MQKNAHSLHFYQVKKIMTSITYDTSTAVIVNDDNTQLHIQAGLLQNAGISARAFGSVRQALLEMAEPPPPDIIITDLYMPCIDGWKFCRLLRSPEYPFYNSIPILVVSATFAGDEANRITADLGANAFLPSPVDGTKFIQTVQLLLAGERPKDRLQVLVVEDSKTQAAIIKEAFEKNGYQAFVASDLSSAVNSCKNRFFDLAVLDFHLPDGKGDDLMIRLKKILPDLVCIMITTDPDPELSVAWMQKGAAAYLKKPFKTDYLMELCERARRERSLLRVEDLLEQRTRELSQSKQQYQALVEDLNEVIYRLDHQAIISYVSPSIEAQAGYTPEEIIGKNFLEFVHPEDIDRRMDQYQKIMSGIAETSEYRFLNKKGQSVWVSTCARPIISEEKIIGIQGVLTNISKLKQAEAKIRQLQKAESLDRMAGAVAHHFNNQLSVVMGNLELVLDDLPADSENRENLLHAFDAASKAADKSRQMLRYLGHISGSQTTINLSDLCRQSLGLLQASLPNGVTLNVDFPDSGPLVHADASQIEQVLKNLFTNAQESLPEKQGNIGLVIQTVSYEDISTSNRFPFDWQPQDIFYACLEISDTGCGTSRENIEKLFDPFYTTKFTGRGMGLSVTMGILKTHSGCIIVDSKPEYGSVFRVYLPVCGKKSVDYEKQKIH